MAGGRLKGEVAGGKIWMEMCWKNYVSSFPFFLSIHLSLSPSRSLSNHLSVPLYLFRLSFLFEPLTVLSSGRPSTPVAHYVNRPVPFSRPRGSPIKTTAAPRASPRRGICSLCFNGGTCGNFELRNTLRSRVRSRPRESSTKWGYNTTH